MKRLIRKASILSEIDLSGSTVKVSTNQQLSKEFAYKMEQANKLITFVKEINVILDGQTEDFKEDQLQKLESYVSKLQELDNNSFSSVDYCVSNLNTLISKSREKNKMWDDYQSLAKQVQDAKKSGEKLPNEDEIMQQLTEISKTMFGDSKTNVDVSNGAYTFASFFFRISEETIPSLYNEAGQYYALDSDENIIQTKALVDFDNFCRSVSNEPQEIEMGRTQYIKEYLLKTILGDNYETYLSNVDNYLHSSSKDSLDQIVQITINNSDMLELNKIVAGDVSVVYRGMSFSDKDDIYYEEIIGRGEVETTGDLRYVSTSTSQSTAKQFASTKIDGSEGFGAVLTIQPGTIVYSSGIAGGVFGEGEIIIDMQDSVITNIEEV
jgi:outer membrane protein assembly factor BamB